MKRLLAILLLIPMLLCVFPFGVVASEKPWGSVEFNGHYYRFYSNKLSYTDAKAFCEAEGGHLATVTTSTENEFVASLFSGTSIWLGGNDIDTEGTFRWVTGEYFAYSNWAPGEPNNGKSNQDYMQMYENGTWDDLDEMSRSFVCEWDSWKDEPVTISIPADAIQSNGHAYAFFDIGCTWDEAAEYCAKMGGYLVTITSEDENWAVNWICGSRDIWLGANDVEVEGEFKWITGEAMTYTLWSAGEPNDGNGGGQDYMHMYTSGAWDDGYGGTSLPFVCEWDFICADGKTGYLYHTWSDWKIVDPTLNKCTDVIEEVRECTHCKKQERNTINPSGHSYSSRQRVSGSIFIPPIVEEEKCVNCGGRQIYTDWSFVWLPIVCIIALTIAIVIIVKKIKRRRRRRRYR